MDHRWHQGAGQEVRREHREHHGQRQRCEQEVDHPAQESDGNEDNADRERRDEGGRGDLLGAVENGLAERGAKAEIAMNVLDLDGRVVHEDADGEPEAAERHDVDRIAESAEQNE
jgi:hypothetical protein